jgi:hypothetical protein
MALRTGFLDRVRSRFYIVPVALADLWKALFTPDEYLKVLHLRLENAVVRMDSSEGNPIAADDVCYGCGKPVSSEFELCPYCGFNLMAHRNPLLLVDYQKEST